MNCEDAQELLNPLVDNELLSKEAKLVNAHLQDCKMCQLEYHLLENLHNKLSKVARYPVPESLIAGVSEQITSYDRKKHPSRPLKRWVILTGTHVASALLGIVIFLNIQPFLGALILTSDDFINLHVRSLMRQNLTQVTAGNSHIVKPWFTGKITYSPPVHDLKTDGFPLIGARIEQLNHQRVAVLVYRRRKHWINLFIAPTDSGKNYDIRYVRWNRNGYHAVNVQQGDFTYWGVSDLSYDELEKFMKTFVSKNST